MKRTVAAFAALVVMCGVSGPVVSSAATSGAQLPLNTSPPGQISLSTVNARQNKILGQKRFEDLMELTLAYRSRPLAFDGGKRGAITAPDVAVITEFRETNIEILTRELGRKFDEPYVLVGPTDVQAALIINTRTVELQGPVHLVHDVCMNDETSEVKRLNRRYPVARLKEVESGSTFTVAGVHLAKDYYAVTGVRGCVPDNIRALRADLQNEPGAAFVAGDFNFRPTISFHECDPDELDEPSGPWSLMTQGDGEEGARQFLDVVQAHHRGRSRSMANEWTYESPVKKISCNGSEVKRRSRIDYIFASDVEVAEAHADHPGWSIPANHKYSDHRWVLGRFVLTGPPRVARPTADQLAGGVIRVTWEPVEGATEWIVYRARPNGDYAAITSLSSDITTFEDLNTTHGVTYRYAIAPVGADGGQGVESARIREEADAQGPAVTSIIPARGAEKVRRDITIRATFNEWVAAASVGANAISVFRDGRRISGRVIRKGGFVTKFDPTYPLKRGETYTIVVRPVQDVLGNTGPVFKSRFSTVEPRKKRRR